MSGSAHFTWQRAVYRAAWTAATPFALAAAVLHPQLRSPIRERLGWIDGGQPGGVWLHAASAGDVVAVSALVRALRRRDLPVVLTTSTATGRQLAPERAGQPAFALPFDHPWAVRRALRRTAPRLLLLEARELWPELLLEARTRGVPCAVVNARMSLRSLRSYLRWRGLFGPVLESLACWCAVGDEEASRLVAAGVPEGRVVVTGDTKLDAAAEAAMGGEAPRMPDDPPRVVFASIHAGEEAEAVARAAARVHASHPGVRFDLAVRYASDERSIARTLARQAGGAEIRIRAEMGALASLYPGASAAFVGGSLCQRGAHSVAEPAAAGVPFAVGPSQRNIGAAMRALQGPAVRTVADATELASALSGWLADVRHRRSIGTELHARLLAAWGSTRRTLDALAPWLG